MEEKPLTPKNISSGWNDSPKRVMGASNTVEVKSGEYDGLLERYKITAERMGIKNPPPLMMHNNKYMGHATGTTNAVTIPKKLLTILTQKEMDAVLAHELGHVKDQRNPKREEGVNLIGNNGNITAANPSEISADGHAIKAGIDPEVLIGALRKTMLEQAKEQGQELREALHKNFPNLSDEKIEEQLRQGLPRFQQQQQEFLDSRIQGIRNASR